MPHRDLHRGAIGDDVMKAPGQESLLAGLNKMNAKQRVVPKGHWAAHQVFGMGEKGGFGVVVRREIDHFKRWVDIIVNPLARLLCIHA